MDGDNSPGEAERFIAWRFNNDEMVGEMRALNAKSEPVNDF